MRKMSWREFRLPVLVFVTLGCSSGGGDESGSSAPPASIPAEGPAAEVGLTGYGVQVSGVSATVQLLGHGGLERGTLVIEPASPGFLATATVAGATVTERTWDLPDGSGGTWVLRERQAAGATLRTEALLDGAGEVVWAALVAPLPEGVEIPPQGGVRPTATGYWAVYPLAGEGADQVGDVAGWLEAAGVASAVDSQAGLLLSGAVADPGLIGALGEALAAEAEPSPDPGKVQGAIHLSGPCKGLAKQVQQSKHACCVQCSHGGKDALNNAITAVIGVLGSAEAALATRPGCSCCKQKLGLDMAKIVECVESYNSGKTDKHCANETQGLQPWEKGVASADGHSCRTTCDNEKCKAYCSTELGSSIASCMAEQCVCRLEEPLCDVLHPGQNCSATGFAPAFGLLMCSVAKCGDGKVVNFCPKNPDQAELCDPTKPTGECRCEDDCKTCSTCDCDPKAPASWPKGKVCTPNCALADKPKCSEDVQDFFLSSGEWCDPQASASWCAEGTTCSPDTCRCVKDAATPGTPPAGGDQTTCGTGCTLCLKWPDDRAVPQYVCDSLAQEGVQVFDGAAYSQDAVCYPRDGSAGRCCSPAPGSGDGIVCNVGIQCLCCPEYKEQKGYCVSPSTPLECPDGSPSQCPP